MTDNTTQGLFERSYSLDIVNDCKGIRELFHSMDKSNWKFFTNNINAIAARPCFNRAKTTANWPFIEYLIKQYPELTLKGWEDNPVPLLRDESDQELLKKHFPSLCKKYSLLLIACLSGIPSIVKELLGSDYSPVSKDIVAAAIAGRNRRVLALVAKRVCLCSTYVLACRIAAETNDTRYIKEWFNSYIDVNEEKIEYYCDSDWCNKASRREVDGVKWARHSEESDSDVNIRELLSEYDLLYTAFLYIPTEMELLRTAIKHGSEDVFRLMAIRDKDVPWLCLETIRYQRWKLLECILKRWPDDNQWYLFIPSDAYDPRLKSIFLFHLSNITETMKPCDPFNYIKSKEPGVVLHGGAATDLCKVQTYYKDYIETLNSPDETSNTRKALKIFQHLRIGKQKCAVYCALKWRKKQAVMRMLGTLEDKSMGERLRHFDCNDLRVSILCADENDTIGPYRCKTERCPKSLRDLLKEAIRNRDTEYIRFLLPFLEYLPEMYDDRKSRVLLPDSWAVYELLRDVKGIKFKLRFDSIPDEILSDAAQKGLIDLSADTFTRLFDLGAITAAKILAKASEKFRVELEHSLSKKCAPSHLALKQPMMDMLRSI